MQQLGATRSCIQSNHALITPDTFVRAPLPGMRGATAIVHTSPRIGAAFVQYTAEFEAGGALGQTQLQRFIYVLEGELEADATLLGPGGFAYLPGTVIARTKARAAMIEKPYHPLTGIDRPAAFSGNEASLPGEPLNNDPALIVRKLIPDSAGFDFAVNTMEYLPGATLPMVEIHVMEHGLLMLEGGGIYRLDERWYPVTAGDFIWMGPYCPQWFGALGKTPAKYLIYKDWNRSPL